MRLLFTTIVGTLLLDLACSFQMMHHAVRPSEAFLLMGGYYSEPEANNEEIQDDRPRHMLFGIQYVEGVLNVPGCQAIKYLEAITEDGTESSMTAFADTLSRHMDLTSIESMVELGSSVVSLAAARLGASQVTAYDTNEDRLRILQHTDCFVNSPSPSCAVKTVKLTTDKYVPEVADLVIITTANMPLLFNCINEAINRNIPVVLPEEIVQLPHVLDLFPSGWRPMGGVFVFDPTQRLTWK